MLLWVVGCAPELIAPRVVDDPTGDFDHDGYSEQQGDCADDDPLIHPGAVEDCDGRDQDCDGLIDEDGQDAFTWYLDQDGDGFGGQQVRACARPEDGVEQSGDCDDQDPQVHPEAAESCGGSDEDCDGEVDEVDAEGCELRYLDLDGDGHGGPESLCLCEEVHSASYEDCDDLDPMVHPEADEVCGNGVDDDCDGQAIASCTGGEISAAQADLKILPEGGGDYLGAELESWDIEGDGQLELLIGAMGHEGLAAQSGRVVLVDPRSATDGLLELEDEEPLWHLDGETRNHWLGSGLLRTDLDADGQADLLVGAYGEDSLGKNTGAVYLLLGPLSASGLATEIADATFRGHAQGDKAGDFMSDLGDLDGDGLADLAIAGARASYELSQEGAAYVVLGPVSTGEHDLADADLVLTGASDRSAAGASIEALDLDGDGSRELLVGAYQYSAEYSEQGAAYVVDGDLRGRHRLDEVATSSLVGSSELERLGVALGALGDLDGDGVEDWAVSATREPSGGVEAGLIRVFLGPVSAGLHSSADAELRGDYERNHAGGRLRRAGDWDGDGQDEFLTHADETVALVSWPTPVLVRDAGTLWLGEGEDDFFGSDLLLGQFGADDFPDLVVGAQQRSAEVGANGGAVYLFHGSPPQ